MTGAIVAGLIGLALVFGFPWVAARYFWIDIAVGFAVALFFVGLAERPSIVARVLSSGPLDFLGRFSYSLYLVHGPIRHVPDVLSSGREPFPPIRGRCICYCSGRDWLRLCFLPGV